MMGDLLCCCAALCEIKQGHIIWKYRKACAAFLISTVFSPWVLALEI